MVEKQPEIGLAGPLRFGRVTAVALICALAASACEQTEKAQEKTGLGESIQPNYAVSVLGLDAVSRDPHEFLLDEGNYPSARRCRECHPNIYDEWASSAHAYSAISPMFHRFEQKINELASGTVGAFCVRCHIPIGTAMNEPRETPLYERARVSTEGVTCIVCHRVNENYGKVNGERRVLAGPIFDPVYGSQGGPGLIDVLKEKARYGVTDTPGGTGTQIHGAAYQLEQMSKAEFCAPCHQVAVHPGIKLEVVWDQYRASPAESEGITCQDCHMGKEPGHYLGEDNYPKAPRAMVNGVPVRPGEKHSDHSMVGPGYSTAHPGIFPHHARGDAFTIDEWMTFDWRAGWGSPEFEGNADAGAETSFPPEWQDPTRRREARRIVEENQATLAARELRRKFVMEIGSQLDGPFFDDPPRVGESFSFSYRVSNVDKGHNLPSGSLGAQPEIWLNVALVDPDGNNVWESGYLDSHGDMADLHSRDVLAGTLPHDDQLFNLQTKFLTTNVKGTDREMFLPVNMDVDQIPFIRPAGQPVSVMNHPPFIRMEQRSIPPLGSKMANYTVPASVMTKPGTWKLAVRLRSRAEPIYFMDFCGATDEMTREMNRRMIDFHPYTVAFEVK